eukprot:3134296-Alexandrium_andersonii.AAC.1
MTKLATANGYQRLLRLPAPTPGGRRPLGPPAAPRGSPPGEQQGSGGGGSLPKRRKELQEKHWHPVAAGTSPARRNALLQGPRLGVNAIEDPPSVTQTAISPQ